MGHWWETALVWFDPYRSWVAAAVALAGLLLVAWAIFPRYARVVGACWKCGYDLRGLDSDVCPECGGVFRRRDGRVRRPRRWGWAMVGLGLLPTAWYLRVALDVHERGWVAAVPSIVLACVLGVDETNATTLMADFGDPWSREFEERLRNAKRWCGDGSPFSTQPTMPIWVRGLWCERVAAKMTRVWRENGWGDASLTARVYDIAVELPESNKSFPWDDDTADHFAGRVAKHIQLDVAPETWMRSGEGFGGIVETPSHLIVRAMPETHQAVAKWIDRYRALTLAERVRRFAHDPEQVAP